VRNIVKRYGSIIEKDVHPHTFRHSYAIHCVRNGWDIRRLQQVLGHSSLNVTAVYLQFNDADIKELYDKTPFLNRATLLIPKKRFFKREPNPLTRKLQV
jgi:site-specific recombinase XerD